MKFGNPKTLFIDKNKLFEQVSHLEVFSKYISGFDRLNKLFNSEIRNDTKPTCNIFIDKNGEAKYKDHRYGILNCIEYTQEKFGLSYQDALVKIATDFNVLENNGLTLNSKVKKVTQYEHKEYSFLVNNIPFTQKAIDYWLKYDITLELLKKYNVTQIDYYYKLEDKVITKKRDCYFSFCYHFLDGSKRIYSPENTYLKWEGNLKSDKHIFGFEQLEYKSDTLLIASSMKDLLQLVVLGHTDVIAPLAENVPIPSKIIEYLKTKYKYIILVLDFDKWGIVFAEKYSKLYSCDYVDFSNVDLNTETKDVSDFYAENKNQCKLTINKLIQECKMKKTKDYTAL